LRTCNTHIQRNPLKLAVCRAANGSKQQQNTYAARRNQPGERIPVAVACRNRTAWHRDRRRQRRTTTAANGREIGNARSKQARSARFSLASVQLKFSAVGLGGKQLHIPAQGRDGQSIVKLPSPRFPKVPENEFAMMTLAKDLGIDVPEFGLTPIGSIGNLPPEFPGDQNERVLHLAFRPRAGRRADSYRRFQSDLGSVFGKEIRAAWIHERGQGHLGAPQEERISGIHSPRHFQRGDWECRHDLKNWSLLYRDAERQSLRSVTTMFRPCVTCWNAAWACRSPARRTFPVSTMNFWKRHPCRRVFPALGEERSARNRAFIHPNVVATQERIADRRSRPPKDRRATSAGTTLVAASHNKETEQKGKLGRE